MNNLWKSRSRQQWAASLLIPSALAVSLSYTSLSYGDELIAASDSWELQANEGNIQVYTRDYEGSTFEAFKAVAILDAPINNIMSVMVTAESCLEWVHGCSVSYALEMKSFYKRYAYSVNDLPWPFKDRDYVLEINTSNDPQAGTISMEMHASQGVKAPDDDYVRVDIAQTIYEFTPLDNNKTRMVWLQHTDPAGVLPGWLVNQLIIDIPVQSLQALEKVANLDKYQGATIEFDASGKIIDVIKPQ